MEFAYISNIGIQICAAIPAPGKLQTQFVFTFDSFSNSWLTHETRWRSLLIIIYSSDFATKNASFETVLTLTRQKRLLSLYPKKYQDIQGITRFSWLIEATLNERLPTSGSSATLELGGWRRNISAIKHVRLLHHVTWEAFFHDSVAAQAWPTPSFQR